MNPLSLTGSFQALLLPSTKNVQVQCFSAKPIFTRIAEEISNDYYTFVELIIESFDIAPNIRSINQAPFPNTTDLDSRNEQATKVFNNWITYEKVGLQLLYDDGGGIFKNQGQPIILQNTPFQLPVQYLRPYLSATQEVVLIGSEDRIGIQVLPDYQQLSGTDQILVKGQWKADIKIYEKKSQAINNWFPIGIDLPADEPRIIRPANNKRRILYLVNAGNSSIRFFYGDISQVLQNSCPYLLPNGSFNQEILGNYTITQQLVALSVGQAGRLVGMEGSL